MEGVGFGIFVVLAIFAGIGIWVFSMSLDKERITDYIRQQGGRIVSINWAPFGKGWFGEKEERIYEVVYYDQAGHQHFATCKTSKWTGVFWTEDRKSHNKSGWYDSLPPGNEPGKPIISQIPKKAVEEEAEELQRLREENARLRQQLGERNTEETAIQPERCPACGAAITLDAARCPDCQIVLR